MDQRSRSALLPVLVLAIVTMLQLPALADDEHTPIKVGYVVITPTSATTAGLVVFETFGEHKEDGFGNKSFTQAGVLPSMMTTHAALFADADGRLSKNLGVALANPSGSPATITLKLRNAVGVTVATTSFVLDAHKQTAFFVTQMFEDQKSVPKDFTGTVDISSDIPIAVMGLRLRGSNYSTIPATILGPVAPVPAITTNVGGPASVILAHFAAGGGWASELVLANFGPDSITVRVDLFGPDGTPLTVTLNGQSASSFQDIAIPAGGVVILASDNDEDENAENNDNDDGDEDD